MKTIAYKNGPLTLYGRILDQRKCSTGSQYLVTDELNSEEGNEPSLWIDQNQILSDKAYMYKNRILYVGRKVEDINGFTWEIIWCGPKQVKAILLDMPMNPPSYTAHWHFVLNILNRGSLTERYL